MKRTILNGLLGLVLAAGLQAKVSTGDSAPEFSLPSHEGKTVKLSDYKGKTVVLEWINEGCPFVVKHYDSSGNLPKLQKKYTAQGVVWLGIVSSAVGEQGYWATGEEAKAWADKHKAGLNAILFDPEGTVGKAYGAKTTPHMYIISQDGKLVYQGAIDSKASTKAKDIKGSTNWVAQALDEVLAGKEISVTDTKPYGCSVKYKKK